jgi:hypothetical protein
MVTTDKLLPGISGVGKYVKHTLKKIMMKLFVIESINTYMRKVFVNRKYKYFHIYKFIGFSYELR